VLNGRNSDPIELGNEKAVVLRVKEHQPASDKPLSEVKEAILAKLRNDDARKETGKQVEALLKQVREGKPLADAAKSMNLAVTKPPVLRRTEATLPQPLVSAVFKAPRSADGKSVPGSAELENGDQIVFGVLAVKDGTPAAVDAKEQESAREFLAKTEGQREFSSFVARLREIADVKVKPES
jgi:peptidyl-prolyl cis-trans isomerase D